MKKTALACATAAILLSGCSHSKDAALPPDVTRKFEDYIATQNAALAASLFTDDAEIFSEGRPLVHGRRNIRQYLADQMSPTILFDADTRMSLVRDDLALETGAYTFRDTRKGVDIEHGKYMHAWRRQGAAWKLFRAMYNSDEPLAAKASVSYSDE